jgi:homoserine kinase type II
VEEVEPPAVADTLVESYGLRPVTITLLLGGTATANYLVTDHSGQRWVAKVYRDRGVLQREREAVALAEFARAAGVPVPELCRTRQGALVDESARRPMSLWRYIDAETAEGGLAGDRWHAVGAVVGRLHRRLARHPAAAPRLSPATKLCDLERSRLGFDWLIREYSHRSQLDSFQAWALDAARQRRALLDRVAAVLARLPALTEHVVHGDLAAPNLLLRGDEVVAVLDFRPPAARHLAWEIARIGCDPRTLVLGDQWLTGLPSLLAAYWEENPAIRFEDLVSTVAVGCAYALASTYPLAEPLTNPRAVNASLRAYGRARHEAALRMLDHLDGVEERIRDQLR